MQEEVFGGDFTALSHTAAGDMHPKEQWLLRIHRKRIETSNSQLKQMEVARIYSRIVVGISLKIATLLCALNVSNHH
jgi:hypothetical protein